MRAPLPPNYKKPLMATQEFRWFVIAAAVGFAALAVIVVEVIPKMRAAEEVSAKMQAGAPRFTPRPAGSTAPREQRFDGVLDKVKDGSPIEQQDEPYTYLVRHLAKADGAAITKDAKRVDYKYFAQMPEDVRGQTVRLNGLYGKTSTLRLDQKQGNQEWVYRTYLISGDATEGFVVDFLERPPQLDERRSMVTMDAVFLKLGTYEGKNGPVQAPFFVGKSLRAVAGAAATSSVSFGTMVIGVAVVSGLFMLFLTLRIVMSRSSSRGTDQAVSIVQGKA